MSTPSLKYPYKSKWYGELNNMNLTTLDAFDSAAFAINGSSDL
jgi:hypothetical protein